MFGGQGTRHVPGNSASVASVAGAVKLRQWGLATPDCRAPSSARIERHRGQRLSKLPLPLQSATKQVAEVTESAPPILSKPNGPDGDAPQFCGNITGVEFEKELRRLGGLVKSLVRDLATMKDSVWHLEDDGVKVHDRLDLLEHRDSVMFKAEADRFFRESLALDGRLNSLESKCKVQEVAVAKSEATLERLTNRVELLDTCRFSIKPTAPIPVWEGERAWNAAPTLDVVSEVVESNTKQQQQYADAATTTRLVAKHDVADRMDKKEEKEESNKETMERQAMLSRLRGGDQKSHVALASNELHYSDELIEGRRPSTRGEVALEIASQLTRELLGLEANSQAEGVVEEFETQSLLTFQIVEEQHS